MGSNRPLPKEPHLSGPHTRVAPLTREKSDALITSETLGLLRTLESDVNSSLKTSQQVTLSGHRSDHGSNYLIELICQVIGSCRAYSCLVIRLL